jgi:hypothetical protein
MVMQPILMIVHSEGDGCDGLSDGDATNTDESASNGNSCDG